MGEIVFRDVYKNSCGPYFYTKNDIEFLSYTIKKFMSVGLLVDKMRILYIQRDCVRPNSDLVFVLT